MIILFLMSFVIISDPFSSGIWHHHSNEPITIAHPWPSLSFASLHLHVYPILYIFSFRSSNIQFSMLLLLKSECVVVHCTVYSCLMSMCDVSIRVWVKIFMCVFIRLWSIKLAQLVERSTIHIFMPFILHSTSSRCVFHVWEAIRPKKNIHKM